MLIISKFKDYYDTASMYGIDKTIVYTRKKQISVYDYSTRHGQSKSSYRSQYMRPELTENLDKWSRIAPFDSIEASVIGFCGKLYPVYVFRQSGRVDYCYTPEETKEVFKQHEMLEDRRFSLYYSNPKDEGYIDKFFDQQSWKYLEPLFFDLKEPIFILKASAKRGIKTLIETGPQLKKYKFGRHFSAPLAFQEVQNYISGVIGVGTPDMVQISNKDKIHKKGYDKWSFRTHKEDSKKPRKKK